MEPQVPLSVVILTKNEASRIRACIASVQPWADDVLVVDDESTDETVDIAESCGARVLRRKMDVEGRHRNWAHAQAKHDWVLSLDADERVSPALAQEIQRLLREGAPYETYAIPRRNHIGTRWIRYGGWYPSAQMKLFKKSVLRWEEAAVHPRALSDKAWGVLRHDLLHFSYRDTQDFRQKLDRQTTLEAEKWVSSGRRMSLGKALWRTIDRGLRCYLLKQGFREGRWGLLIAWMAGRYQWLSYCKYRRLKQAAASSGIPDGSAPSTATLREPAPATPESS